MNRFVLAGLLFVSLCWASPEQTAERLARLAHKAQESGQIVRAYLLYSQAAALEPHNPTYGANRDALASAAKLLTKADVETADIAPDLKAAGDGVANMQPPVEFATEREWSRKEDLQPLPHLQPRTSLATFNTRTDEKSLFEQVAAVYGIRPIFDPQFDPKPDIRFAIDQANFHTAMEALTDVTHTFVFPISQHEIFIARDVEAKREEYEPNILLTFPLPNALDQRDLIEAATAVRTVLGIRAIGWDSAARTVLVRDRYTRARVARSLLEALLLPRAQLSVEIEFLTFDSDRSYQYGVSLPTAFQLVDFGHIGGFKNILPALTSPPTFLALGGGATLFGIGLTNASVFAQYSNSFSRKLYDATVVVSAGQTASLHIGDQYPIAQSLYTGFSQAQASIYNPAPQITMEDLGIVLKLTPRVNGSGDISLDLEGDYKTLGTQTFNSVPAIGEREFKGSISIREDEWAIIAGMNSSSISISKNGFPGLGQIPGIKEVFTQTTKDTTLSDTLLVIKPTVTRLPMSAEISPQYLLGPLRGERVLE